MKIRKNISKLLGLSLFMSNFSLYSTMATSNNEIPNRYETLEGEYITIDDSTEGEIKSIEILGNTVQDENNLEDIQSVGDLYVDENGNPILDKDGNEQYKIEIVSTGKNLLNAENEYDVDIRKRFIKAYELKSNTNYTLSLNYLKGENFAVLLSNTYSETLNHDVLYKEVVTDSDGIEITARLTNSVTFNSQNYKYMYVTSWVYDQE